LERGAMDCVVASTHCHDDHISFEASGHSLGFVSRSTLEHSLCNTLGI